MFGAIDIAAPLCRLARDAGWSPYVVDPRAHSPPRERFPDAEQVIAAWPEEAFEQLGGIDPATSIAVLTHDPKIDDAALQIALRSPARFIGAMGSKRAQAKRRERLLASGLPTRSSSGCRPRWDSTWERSAARRRRCRSSPRSWPPATVARAAGWPTARAHPRGCGLIAGLILAAGAGTRFGDQPKLLADLDGRPLLEYAIRAQCAVAELERVVVVLGSHADEVLARRRLRARRAGGLRGLGRGQAASLRCGARGRSATRTKVIVTLGDAPLVTPEVIARFRRPAGRPRAMYDGRPGPSGGARPEQIRGARLAGGDRGARELLRGGPVIECGELCSGRDVDTPDDLEAIRHEARAVV